MTNTPQAGSGVTEAIRDAGGIVHRDGNIFFTNAEQFLSAAAQSRPPIAQDAAAVAWISSSNPREAITSEKKADLEKFNGAPGKKVAATFDIPCFATPANTAAGAGGLVGVRKETDQRDKMLDARRYETLRHCRGQEHDPLFCVRDEEGNVLWGGDLDDALDEASAYAQDIYGEDTDREALKKGSPAIQSARNPDEEVMEQIAAQWDGCFCDIAAVGMVDIGATIRDDWKRYNGLAPEQATTGNGQGDAKDAARLKWVADEYIDIETFEMPTGSGDADIGWVFFQHNTKHGRTEIYRHYRDELPDAIDAAILSTASPAGEGEVKK